MSTDFLTDPEPTIINFTPAQMTISNNTTIVKSILVKRVLHTCTTTAESPKRHLRPGSTAWEVTMRQRNMNLKKPKVQANH